MKFLPIILLSLCIHHPLWAGILGRFEHIRNLPGYMEFYDQDSYVWDAQRVLQLKGHPKDDGVERRSPSRMLQEDYLFGDGTIDVQEIQRKIMQAENLVMNAFLLYCGDKGRLNCSREWQNPDSTLYQKWQGDKVAVAGEFVVSELQRAIELSRGLHIRDVRAVNDPQVQNFVEALLQGLETHAAIVSEQDDKATNMGMIIKGVRNLIERRVRITNTEEAVNLEIPFHSDISPHPVFFSPETLRQANYDLSLYDPVESGFWRHPQVPISQFDTSNYNDQLREAFGEEKFARIADIEDPDTVIDVEYLKILKGGATPKMKVDYRGFEMKMKFIVNMITPDQANTVFDVLRLFRRIDSEVRCEFVANNLAAALGFTVDPTYYKKRVRLFLPDDFDPELAQTSEGRRGLRAKFERAKEELLDDLENRRRNSSLEEGLLRWDYLSMMQNEGMVGSGEQKGRHFLYVDSSSFEFRRQEDVDFSVGLFHKYGHGKYLKREFRAFMLFYMWVSDTDARNSNASLGLVRVDPSEQNPSEKKVYYSATDMGAALGNFFGRNRPNYLDYNLVNEEFTQLTGPEKQQVLVLNTVDPKRNPLLEAVNFSDVKWITRMMAQLTKEQIKRAFLTANYPEVVAELFTQKLLRRRDQLVQAFGLDRELVRTHGPTPGTMRISGHTSDIVDPVSYFVPNCQECFEKGELVRLPEGVVADEGWLDSLKVFPKDSTQRRVVATFKDLLVAMGAKALGGPIQRYGIYPGLSFDGIRTGVNSFLPARYLLPNPYADVENKFWVVDVFRFALGVGYYHREDDTINLSLRRDRFRGGGGVVETFEFIKVHPVSESDQYTLQQLQELYHPRNMVVRPLSRLKNALVDGMQRGDLAVASRYLTFGAGMTSEPAALSLGFEAFGEVTTGVVDRVTIFQEDDTRAMVSWSDLSHSGLKAGVMYNAFIYRFPLLALQYERLREDRKVYRFDLSLDEDKAFLLDNMNRDIPGDIPSRYVVHSAHIERSTRQFMLSFLGLGRRHWYRRITNIRLSDAEEQLLKDMVLAERGKSGIKKMGSTALIDRMSGTVMGKIDIKYLRDYATREHYKDMLDEFRGMLPHVMIQFDANSVNYYLGNLDLEGQVFFSDQAMRDILGHDLDRMGACRTFAHYGRLKWQEDGHLPRREEIQRFCHRVVEERMELDDVRHPRGDREQELRGRELLFGVQLFMGRLMTAQRRFAEFQESLSQGEDTEREARRLAQSVASLLHIDSAKGPAHLALLSLTSMDKIYRKMEIHSHLEGFPGQEATVSLDKTRRGSKVLRRHPLWDLEHPAQLLETSMEPALLTLAPFFFNRYWSHSVSQHLPEVNGKVLSDGQQ